MSEPRPELPLCELVPDGWRELDDTLADDPSTAPVPDVARRWLAEQRLMHGLLRALHTADAGAREARIANLLARIDSGRIAGARRHWAIVGVAATLLASLVIWFALPERLPTADAAVDRIVSEMKRDVDRRYRVEVRTFARGKRQGFHVFSLVTRSGLRFRVDGKFSFQGQEVAEFRIGSDGEELWVQPAHGRYRHAVPLAEREKLLGLLGDVLDFVDLDVNALIDKLPVHFDVRVAGRHQTADGRELLRVEATKRAGVRSRLRSAWLLVDEASGKIHQVGLRGIGALGVNRNLRLDYLGEEPAGLVDYHKPW